MKRKLFAFIAGSLVLSTAAFAAETKGNWTGWIKAAPGKTGNAIFSSGGVDYDISDGTMEKELMTKHMNKEVKVTGTITDSTDGHTKTLTVAKYEATTTTDAHDHDHAHGEHKTH